MRVLGFQAWGFRIRSSFHKGAGRREREDGSGTASDALWPVRRYRGFHISGHGLRQPAFGASDFAGGGIDENSVELLVEWETTEIGSCIIRRKDGIRNGDRAKRQWGRYC